MTDRGVVVDFVLPEWQAVNSALPSHTLTPVMLGVTVDAFELVVAKTEPLPATPIVPTTGLVWPRARTTLRTQFRRVRTAMETAVLAAQASETGTVVLTAGYRLYAIGTTSPARVRLYTTPAHRDADLARKIGADPTGDHGLVVDVVTTDPTLLELSPLVDGAQYDGAVPFTITNLAGSSARIIATIDYLPTEA